MKTKEILEKIKNFLIRYNIYFVIPVILLAVSSIWFVNDSCVKLCFFILTWILITFQFIGVLSKYYKIKHDNLESIEKYKENIKLIKNSLLYTKEEKMYMIDSCNQIIDILTPKKINLQ